jgi:predicted NBD/HSP70 family sugar kinase
MSDHQLTKQSQASVKTNNLRLVLETIIRHDPLSRADLVRRTNISKPTVSSLIDELLAKGIISEIGVGKSKGGRKPILIHFNRTSRYFLAFEMGRASYRIALADMKGLILQKKEGEFPGEAAFSRRLELLRIHIGGILESVGIAPDKILKMICIAPGIYVGEGNELRWYPGNAKNDPEDIRRYFQKLFKCDIRSEHSTKLSLLGEQVAGKAKNHRHVLYIDFAYGLGSAIMINGTVYSGPNKSAGEIGYFYSNPEEFKSGAIMPYEFGALEKKISGKAMQTRGREAVMNHRNTKIAEIAGGDLRNITSKTVFQAAMQKDPVAYSILSESFTYFNMALCNMINMFNPELVIFGGGFSNAGSFLLEFIEKEIANKVLIMPALEVSDLRNDSCIIGAVQYLINNTDYLTELSNDGSMSVQADSVLPAAHIDYGTME